MSVSTLRNRTDVWYTTVIPEKWRHDANIKPDKATVCGTDTAQESIFPLLEPVVQWTLLHILVVLGVSSLEKAMFNTNNRRNLADNCACSGSLPLNTQPSPQMLPLPQQKYATRCKAVVWGAMVAGKTATLSRHGCRWDDKLRIGLPGVGLWTGWSRISTFPLEKQIQNTPHKKAAGTA